MREAVSTSLPVDHSLTPFARPEMRTLQVNPVTSASVADQGEDLIARELPPGEASFTGESVVVKMQKTTSRAYS